MVLEDKSTATQCWVGGKDELYTMVRNGMKPAILDEDIYTICLPNLVVIGQKHGPNSRNTSFN